MKDTKNMSAAQVVMPEPRVTFNLNSEEERKTGLSKLAMVTAKNELCETSSGREQALTILRDWVVKHPQLINVRTDDNFLLRFLRIRKYNVPMAEHTLVKYLNFRRSIPDFSTNLDCNESKVAQLITDGYLFPSPIRDRFGRRVVIAIAEKLNPTKYTKVEMAKAHLLLYETLLENEEDQIMGLTYFGDIKAVSMAHVAMWSPLEMAICLRIGEQAVPIRHKAIHIINYSSPLKYLYDFASSRVTPKIKGRTMLHQSMEELYKHLEPECLPKEYGGTIPMAEMIDMWKKELAESRSRLLQLDAMKSLVPIKRRTQVEDLAGSFKKLEVD